MVPLLLKKVSLHARAFTADSFENHDSEEETYLGEAINKRVVPL